ncbi:hypothetical protein ACJMK2_006762 [Sinanodonta woodiana]|uniref:ATP synthase F(0) complex subunit e, mitochondrial n=1 Tax=Sinanodonta woodiana TaxID=1069815 RepID=A0ABD3VUL3_SINWO
MATLAAPRNVSPLIRAARYVALTSGIVYGYRRYNKLAEQEKVIQEEENKIRAINAQRRKEKQEKALAVQMAELAKEVGIIPKSSSAS